MGRWMDRALDCGLQWMCWVLLLVRVPGKVFVLLWVKGGDERDGYVVVEGAAEDEVREGKETFACVLRWSNVMSRVVFVCVCVCVCM